MVVGYVYCFLFCDRLDFQCSFYVYCFVSIGVGD